MNSKKAKKIRRFVEMLTSGHSAESTKAKYKQFKKALQKKKNPLSGA